MEWFDAEPPLHGTLDGEAERLVLAASGLIADGPSSTHSVTSPGRRRSADAVGPKKKTPPKRGYRALCGLTGMKLNHPVAILEIQISAVE
jgi:hypothetical protein